MTNLKTTKRALFSSVVALLVCFTMLLGTTFAWFTDSVTSSENVIQTGTLEIGMYWMEGDEDPTTATWADASEGAIFNNTKWEPGYVEAKHIMIANEGTLALKYQLAIIPTGEVSKLAEVIDVYLYNTDGKLDNATQIAKRTDLDENMWVGTLADVISKGIAQGNLEAEKDYTTTIVLKMQETPGNDYQNLSIGDAFTIQLLATQYTSESDSFDNQYDKGAAWDGTVPASIDDTNLVITPDEANRNGTITVNSAEDLAYLPKLAAEWASLYSESRTGINYTDYAKGEGAAYYYHGSWKVLLNCDINLLNHPWTPIDISFFNDFDGQGHTISNINVYATAGYAGLFSHTQRNINNLNLENAVVNAANSQCVGALIGSSNGSIENVKVTNATIIGNKYVGGVVGYAYGNVNNCSVSNSTVTIPASGNKEAGGIAGYLCQGTSVTGNTVENTTVSAPTIAAGVVAQPNGSFEVSGNNLKNVTIATTADVTAALYVSNNVNGTTIVKDNNTATDCKLVVGVKTAAELQAAIKDGKDVVLANDITVDEWIMFSETLSVASGNIITVKMDGLTIDGNGHTLTINDIESAGNDDRLFHNASNLKIYDLTIKYAEGLTGGISLNSGTISNVNFVGGQYGVLPGTGDVTIEGCTFKTNSQSIYFEGDRDNLVVTGNTFETADGAYAILIRGDVTFTDNTIITGKVNVVNGSPEVTGNDFGNERFKVYNGATATITGNTINILAFNDTTEVKSTFSDNILSTAAQDALNDMNEAN